MMKNTITDPLLLAEEIAEYNDTIGRLNAEVTATVDAYTTAVKAADAARAAKEEFIRTKHWPTDKEFALAIEVVRLSDELKREKKPESHNAQAVGRNTLDERALLLCKDLEDGKPCGRDALFRLLSALRSRAAAAIIQDAT